MPTQLTLPWLSPGQAFPDPTQAWSAESAAPGLLAAGGALDANTLLRAYHKGIFPWFSEGQPPLWWSPSPRMVLNAADFKLHRSLRKTLLRFLKTSHNEIRIDTAFDQVTTACAKAIRKQQNGTWIVPAIRHAYADLHQQGFAHSIETWVDGELVGGLYCVGLGRYVFGESMFCSIPDASKIALAALVCFCRHHQIKQIDCQQHTRHLESLGATPISRREFQCQLENALPSASPEWKFDALYWSNIISSTPVES